MYLTPTEEDRLRLFLVAELARRVRSSGLQLNQPEATAVICDEMQFAARRGASFEEIVEAGKRAVSRDDLMEGVAQLITEIRLEVLMEEGSRLVVLRSLWQ